MTRTRFLSSSIATLAVASAFTLTGGAAHADTLPCGSAAVDAVYTSVVHEPVFRTVAATTHLEWRWERVVTSYENEYAAETSPARTESDWKRQVTGPTEYLFTRTVVVVPAVPAVPGTPETGHFVTTVVAPEVTTTEYEYVQTRSDKLRWEDADWGNKHDDTHDWMKTGNTRQTVVTPAVTTQTWVVDVPATAGSPAVPAQTELQSLWATTTPAGYPGTTSDSRPGAATTEETTTDGSNPAGEDWELVASRTFAAVTDVVWATSAPAGYEPTGASRIADELHQSTDATSAAAPDGAGWTEIADSQKVVTDVPESQELVTDGYLEQVLVSPATPAGPDCVAPPQQDDPEQADPDLAGPQAAAEPSATVLPNTGNPIPPWLAPVGFATVLAGIGLVRVSRRPQN